MTEKEYDLSIFKIKEFVHLPLALELSHGLLLRRRCHEVTEGVGGRWQRYSTLPLRGVPHQRGGLYGWSKRAKRRT
ncbi:hypothetical protein AN643_03595 [Candidatus Epulonipiscioides saccharophilum]|nr:hypothetical protein AN643_03595 [Epulopiscium sp. SCG-B10WGA-EpuloB]